MFQPLTALLEQKLTPAIIPVCLFGLILYVPVNNFSVMSGRVYLGEPVLTRICLAQGHNTVTQFRLKSSTLPVGHCTPPIIPVFCNLLEMVLNRFLQTHVL